MKGPGRSDYLAAARLNLVVALTTDDPVLARVSFRQAIKYGQALSDGGASRGHE